MHLFPWSTIYHHSFLSLYIFPINIKLWITWTMNKTNFLTWNYEMCFPNYHSYPSQQNEIRTIIIKKFHVYLKTVWLLNQNKNALMVKILTSVNSDLTSYLNLQLVFIPRQSLSQKFPWCFKYFFIFKYLSYHIVCT